MPGTGGGIGALMPGGLTEVSYSTNSANALIHLYRAEVGKMTAYRQRLDMTTNWSVVTTAGLASFALGDVNNSHATFLFAMFMNFFFLRLEARRFRSFEIAHHRVRIMERFFYPAMLGDNVDPGWHQLLLAELARPRSPMSRSDAMGWRLSRNYLWIYAAVLLAWMAKLDLDQPKGWVLEFPDALSLADIGSFPGWLVFLGVAVFYAYLIGLALRAARTYPLEEG
ncbi:DUF2270 domain-containing protein [Deinococcus sp. KSM4-11]|uniref:DUF2270 domain-containing protein n=1 Tax=Deinococcus sp. KSM4-11 TaxID=2568654 RepID=UPI0010A3F0FE|nr:DUF2270 domain-containing protein [Deinococcus sp. KSM4-11]THF84013.1 DUF2270 domain-containing protein [Deinococcus sp. KSM4-11]